MAKKKLPRHFEKKRKGTKHMSTAKEKLAAKKKRKSGMSHTKDEVYMGGASWR